MKIKKFILIGITSLSFIICVYGSLTAPSFSFYNLPTRAWELLLGSLIALNIIKIPEKYQPFASLLGIALISISLFTLGPDDPFPGWRALLPAAGTVLIIGSSRTTLVNLLISNPAFVMVGKISYSLYLWHWPIFVFLRHFLADQTLDHGWSLAGISASFALAWLTYYWIERPTRRTSLPFKRISIGALAGALACISLGQLIWLADGFPGRLPAKVISLTQGKFDLAPLAHSCLNTSLENIGKTCHLGPKKALEYVIWGDSHAAAVSEGVSLGLAGRSGAVAAFNACAPSIGWTSPALTGLDSSRCAERNAMLLKQIIHDEQIKVVILSAYWASHARADGPKMWKGVEIIVNQLRSADKRIWILAGIPEPGTDVPWASAIRERFGRTPIKLSCSQISVPIYGATIIDLSSRFCEAPHPEKLFSDSNHPSGTAGRTIIAPAVETFAKSL